MSREIFWMILRHSVHTDATFERREDVTLGNKIEAGDPVGETHWGLNSNVANLVALVDNVQKIVLYP